MDNEQGRSPDVIRITHEGTELRVGVSTAQRRVQVHIGRPVLWFSLTAEQATQLAGLLLRGAETATKNRIRQQLPDAVAEHVRNSRDFAQDLPF